MVRLLRGSWVHQGPGRHNQGLFGLSQSNVFLKAFFLINGNLPLFCNYEFLQFPFFPVFFFSACGVPVWPRWQLPQPQQAEPLGGIAWKKNWTRWPFRTFRISYGHFGLFVFDRLILFWNALDRFWSLRAISITETESSCH